MQPEKIVAVWFEKLKQDKYRELPLSKNFKYTSPFGTINEKSYLNLGALLVYRTIRHERNLLLK